MLQASADIVAYLSSTWIFALNPWPVYHSSEENVISISLLELEMLEGKIVIKHSE